jgi:hypothetical protein
MGFDVTGFRPARPAPPVMLKTSSPMRPAPPVRGRWCKPGNHVPRNVSAATRTIPTGPPDLAQMRWARAFMRKYLGPVSGCGLVPGGLPVMTEQDWRARAQSWFPALVDKGLRQVSWPAIDVYRDYITAQLAAGVTVSTIHQRLSTSMGWRRRWPHYDAG